MGSNKGTCRNNQLHQYRLGADLLERSSAEKDVGDLGGQHSAALCEDCGLALH